jgi:hypothetical protein
MSTRSTKRSFQESMERALARFKQHSLAIGSTAVLIGGTAPMVGCANKGADQVVDTTDVSSGKSDWAEDQGHRDKTMVRYLGEPWMQTGPCNERFCQSSLLFKVLVKPQSGANLSNKKVGAVWRYPGESQENTVWGTFFSTRDDGLEEWHVSLDRAYWYSGILVNAVYQDGKGATFFDDNEGAFHVAMLPGQTPISSTATDSGFQPTLFVDDQGVHGTVDINIPNLAFDKDIELVYTTDGWNTKHTMTIGDPKADNVVFWVQGFGTREQWRAKINLPGDFQQFEYACVYRHAANVPNAQVYEFWDTFPGSNHIVKRK